MLLRLLTIILVLAMASMVCGFQLDLPQIPTAGPAVTEQVNVPVPSGSGKSMLSLGFGAGELSLLLMRSMRSRAAGIKADAYGISTQVRRFVNSPVIRIG